MKGSGRSSKNLKDSQSHTWLNEERRWSAGKKKAECCGVFFLSGENMHVEICSEKRSIKIQLRMYIALALFERAVSFILKVSLFKCNKVLILFLKINDTFILHSWYRIFSQTINFKYFSLEKYIC